MYAMHYKIVFPADYNMETIKKRVKENGEKTDGFKDLLFKAYLITEKGVDNQENSYCPLYLWKETAGMTTFIFDGFFDNIIESFGWKNIEIGIPSKVNLKATFPKSNYVIEEEHDIHKQPSLKKVKLSGTTYERASGQVIIYNPDKWKYVVYSFFQAKPEIIQSHQTLYSILHLSLGD